MNDTRPDLAKLAIEQMQDPQTCLRIALQDPSGDPRRALEAMIAAIDRTLSNQIRPILHHPDFQQLEGAWRGLHYLVTHTETDETLKIKFINLSKAELRETLESYNGLARSLNPLFVQLHDQAYRQPGGEPFGCLVGDYYFDHRPQDVAMLRELADICAIIQAPFLAGGASLLIGNDTWQEGLSCVNDYFGARSPTGEFDPWFSLRDTETARFLYLVIPRFLARPPYGATTQPVAEFDFQEKDEGTYDYHAFTWFNAAYVMAIVITRAFKQHGWCAQIRGRESGGLIENLPTHLFPNDCGGIHWRCYTEIAIGERTEGWISIMTGFISPIQSKNSDQCFFINVQSLRRVREYPNPDDTANYVLSGRLPYLLAACRFAQYLQCIVRDHIDAYRDRRHMQNHLQTWLQQYVCGDLTDDTDENLTRRPLAEARIVIEEIEHTSTYYVAKFFVRPVYQLGGLTSSMCLLLRLPSAK